MHHKLKWDDKTNTGYVENQIYVGGLVIDDPYLKPVIVGIEYEAVNYDEESEVYTITISGTQATITEEQESFVINACINWTPTLFPETVFEFKLQGRHLFESRVAKIAENAPADEISSWSRQEAEARAWAADNSELTPMIDVLLVQRDLNETKTELVDKIILNADTYITLYTECLGKYQKAMRLADAATTIEDLDTIIF